MAAQELYERAARSINVSLMRVIFGAPIAIGLYLPYVGWLAAPASPSAKNNP
ncbi:MAG TPA: hypothetical protein VMB83_04875 [Roseiarcus sp.]|nr:hypothetical protein [Roseiarcus sp.]